MRTTKRMMSCAVAAFGAGILTAVLCPSQLLLIVATGCLVLFGCLRLKT